MKTKRVLKFYYCAENLNKVFDRAILIRAYASAGSAREGGVVAEEICKLIECKQELESLWIFLNGIVATFKDGEKRALRAYALYRGEESLSSDMTRTIKSARIKFVRKAKNIGIFSKALKIVDEWYGVMSTEM